MEFPLGSHRLVIEPPSRRGFLFASAFVLLVALAAIGGWLLLGRPGVPGVESAPPAPGVSLTIASDPPGATILIGGHPRGHTPLTLTVPPGPTAVTLRLARFQEITYTVQAGVSSGTDTTGARLDAVLWLEEPQLRRLRPPLPGATVSDAQFLADGRVVLTVRLPPGEERQAWLLLPGGDARRLGPADLRGPLAPALDGRRLAYLRQSDAAAANALSPRFDEVWIAEDGEGRGERRFALPTSPAGRRTGAGAGFGGIGVEERLLDLAWAPDGSGLLVTAQTGAGTGAVRSRLVRLATDGGDPRELVALPSEIVPGSFTWRPDGGQVAFLASHAGRLALCVLDAASGTPFRYLDDLAPSGPPPLYAPVAWSPADGRLAYPAPPVSTGNRTSAQATTLALSDLSDAPARRLPGIGGTAPAWRADGRLIAFGRRRDGATTLRVVAPAGAGSAQDGPALPLPGGTPTGVRWDLARGQALVLLRAPNTGVDGGFDAWLVNWRPSPAGAVGTTPETGR